VRPFSPPAGWILAAVSLMILAAGVGYVTWWITTPGDCTALIPSPRVWQADGLRPELRRACALHPGEVIVASRRSGAAVVTYTTRRNGDRIDVNLGQTPADLAAALRGGWSILVFTVSFFTLACYAFLRRRRDRAVGPLLLCASALLASSAVTALGLPASATSGAPFALYLVNVEVSYTTAWGALVAWALVFPRGTPLRPGSAAAVYLGPTVVLLAGALAVPAPWGSTGWVGQTMTLQGVITVAAILTAAALAFDRLRRAADPVTRQQLRWLAAGGCIPAALVLAGWFVPALITGSPLLPTAWLGLPGLAFVFALAIAMLRYRLFELDVILSRSVVYALLSLCVVTLHLGIVTTLATIVQSSTATVSGAAVVAVAVSPLRRILQRNVNRLMYGDRDDPYAALRQLGRRLSATTEPAQVMFEVAADVSRALRVPFVAVDLLVDREMTRVAMAGGRQPDSDLVEEQLMHRGEPLGRLVASTRAAGEPLGPADRRLLADLAGQVGAAAQVVLLNLDLQRARERLVLAREEERRSLRRTLHDDVGPTVAALALRAETARRLLADADPPPDPALVELGVIRRDAAAVAARLRVLAYELRPPALDDRGLIGALEERARQLAPFDVTVEATHLADLPAGVEVAAYRIAVEAMTNASRHSGADGCRLRIHRDPRDLLVLEVTDGGRGLGTGLVTGVGISAIRERAEELGGRCHFEDLPGGGTRVIAELPIVGVR
jgi:signal transduction histidine kinase